MRTRSRIIFGLLLLFSSSIVHAQAETDSCGEAQLLGFYQHDGTLYSGFQSILAGNYFYTLAGFELISLNVSDVSHPHLSDRADHGVGRYPNGLVRHGDYVYAWGSSGKLVRIRLELDGQLGDPETVDQIQPSFLEGCSADGFLFLWSSEVVHVYDIRDPNAVQHIEQVGFSATSHVNAASGDQLVFQLDGRLRSYYYVQGSGFLLVSEREIFENGDSYQIDIRGDLVFYVDSEGFRCVDFENLSNEHFLIPSNWPTRALYAFHIESDLVYLLGSRGYLWVYRLNGVLPPERVGSFSPSLISSVSSIRGRIFYTLASANRVNIVDLASVTDVMQDPFYVPAYSIDMMFRHNDRFFIVVSGDRMLEYEEPSPGEYRFLREIALPENTSKVISDGELLYGFASYTGVTRIRCMMLDEADEIVELSEVTLSQTVQRSSVANRMLVIADSAQYIKFLSFEDPRSPRYRGSYRYYGSSATTLEIRWPFLFSTNLGHDLRVFSMADPLNPVLVQTIALGGDINGLSASGSHLWVRQQRALHRFPILADGLAGDSDLTYNFDVNRLTSMRVDDEGMYVAWRKTNDYPVVLERYDFGAGDRLIPRGSYWVDRDLRYFEVGDRAFAYQSAAVQPLYFQGCGTCAPDLTGDGVLDFFDVSAFIVAYLAQDQVADWNDDGLWDFFDVSGFLVDYQGGCS